MLRINESLTNDTPFFLKTDGPIHLEILAMPGEEYCRRTMEGASFQLKR